MTRDQEKKKGTFSKLVYPDWAFRALKDDPLFIEIGRNQIKHRYKRIEVCCTTADQQERLITLLGKSISSETLKEVSQLASS